MKKLLSVMITLLSGGLLCGAEFPFGTIVLDGGRIEPLEMSMVHASNEHLNFCFAVAYPDGTIYLNHSAGIHTVTEHGCRDYSTDFGKTWQKMAFEFGGLNAYQKRDGKKCKMDSWERAQTQTHAITRQTLNADGRSTTTDQSTVTMPFETSFFLHRDVFRTRDGRLLMMAYGKKNGAAKDSSYLLESSDDGDSWHYLSTVLESPANRPYPEGANESAVVELANGDLLAFVRTGGEAPLYQLRSRDGGRSWGEPEPIAKHGAAAPTARILADGTLIVVSGRPNLYLLVDFTGTGNHYQQVELYGGSGSSYASALEIGPNQVLVLYDASDFGTWRTNELFSRIMAAKFKIIRDDTLRKAADDPEADRYDFYYSAKNGKIPQQSRGNMISAYQGDGNQTGLTITTTEQRPYPVLHMEHRGTEVPQKFANINTGLPGDAKDIDLSLELRMGDAAEKRAQFAIAVCLKNSLAWVAFGTDGLTCLNNGKKEKIPFDMGTAFHAFELKTNSAEGTYAIFLKDSQQPLFQGRLTAGNQSPRVVWGDGATDVFGSVDLSCIGWNVR